MSDAYVIELHGETVGIIVRDRADEQYKFLASARAFYGLEGKVFSGPVQAESAARKLLRGKPAAPAKNGPRRTGAQRAPSMIAN